MGALRSIALANLSDCLINRPSGKRTHPLGRSLKIKYQPMLVNWSAQTDTRCKKAGILFPGKCLKTFFIFPERVETFLKELEHAYERNPELNILKAEGLEMKIYTTSCYYSEKLGLWLRWTKHISSFNALDFADCDHIGSFYVPKDLPPKLTDEQVKAAIEIWLGR